MRAPAAVRLHNHKQKKLREAERRRYWKQTACREGCVMCNALRRGSPAIQEIPDLVRRDRMVELREIQGHHILPKNALKRRNLEEHLWDERNGVGLCEYHHGRHTNYVERMPRDLLPPVVYDFAAEIGVDYLIDYEYPL